ncbi:MAG TPA: SDR family NAD(P)-dependent oxidoreductase, partial [Burkholderiales bacterium]|nr:SDR family NAD(P)-dependent oxidoreductase [Burkholderiales bacterium]
MKIVKGKVAAVTGAASGLGRSIALAFAAEGMDVALADVDQEGLLKTQRVVGEYGVKSTALRVDVSKAAEVEAFAERTVKELGAVHVVCNNAGVSPLGSVWENTLA